MLENTLRLRSKQFPVSVLAQQWPQDLTEIPYSGVYHNGRHVGEFSRNWHLFCWNPRVGRWADVPNPSNPLRMYYGERGLTICNYDTTGFDVAEGKIEQQMAAFCTAFDSIPNHYLIFVAASHYTTSGTLNDAMKTRLISIGVPSETLAWQNAGQDAKFNQVMAGFKGSAPGQCLANAQNNAVENGVTAAWSHFRL
jgi:hypothetical protein